MLTMYVVERWWERLSHSPYVNDFVLKGGMLLAAFGSRRPTVDADALARNMAGDLESVIDLRRRRCRVPDRDDHRFGHPRRCPVLGCPGRHGRTPGHGSGEAASGRQLR